MEVSREIKSDCRGSRAVFTWAVTYKLTSATPFYVEQSYYEYDEPEEQTGDREQWGVE